MDKWILSKLSFCVKNTEEALASYNLHDSTTALFSFWNYEFCDIYLEVIKPILYSSFFVCLNNSCLIFKILAKDNLISSESDTIKQILFLCIDTFLRLLSPMMPYITEELWQRLQKRTTETALSICVAQYPKPQQYIYYSEQLEKIVSEVTELMLRIRSVRADCKLLPKQKAISLL